jgi:hypothetical protein
MKTALAYEPSALARPQENRRFQRVKVSLLGRYMLSDKREYPCQVIDMSPGGVAMFAPVLGRPQEPVIAYIDHIGRIEGQLVRYIDGGFAMTIQATARKRDKLAAQLTWLANRHVLGMPEDRRHERFTPRDPNTTLTLADGTVHPCRISDISLSGAVVALSARPPVGSPILLGRIRGRVIRHLDMGLALEFASIQDPDMLELHLH